MQRKRRDLSGVCEPGRSQSPHSTAVVGSKPIVKRPASKTGPREGGQEGADVTSGLKHQSIGIADKATTGAEAHARDPRSTTWAKASVWTERMSCRRRALAARPALGNGVVVAQHASGMTAAIGTV